MLMNAVKASALSRKLEEKGLLEGMILQPWTVTNVTKENHVQWPIMLCHVILRLYTLYSLASQKCL